MVDDKDNHVDGVPGNPGWEIPLLLLTGFRELTDGAHARLAARGFGGVRPAHGFALQAVGVGATATQVGQRLGVSKQAASRTLGQLEAEGYVVRSPDPHDARRIDVLLTDRGRALLAESAVAFAEVAQDWATRVGADRVEDLHEVLRDLGLGAAVRLDIAGWLGQRSSL